MVNKTEFSPQFLVGTWKMKDKMLYEKWSQTGPTEWMGVAYDMTSGIAEINEYLKIYKSDKDWFLEAKTKANQFVPVYFKQINDPFWTCHFVNERHNFPQVISYRGGEDGILYAQIKDLKVSNMIDFVYLRETKK
ncbi:MAG: hypothetical protein IPM48_09735 [Saprospiraceae bacterium]|nr:hypothetical protein [Saprospiraceae bacterium]